MQAKHGGRGPGPAPSSQNPRDTSPRDTSPRGASPFGRPFNVERLHSGETIDMEVTAKDDERAALAEQLAVPRIDALTATFTLTRHGKIVRVVGSVHADILQTCVVTLEPFAATVEESVDLRFAPAAEVEALETAAARRSGDGFIDVAEISNLPDPIVDDRIDLGSVAAEALALGLDPYPRKPGAAFAATRIGDEPEPAEVSPFAVLRKAKLQP